MTFPYIKRDRLERRLQVDATALGMPDEDWLTVLDEVRESESERVEGAAYAGVTYRDLDSTDDVPSIVREAVIRLCRARIFEIRTDGLESENTGDNASYNYRSPADIRAEVKAELQAADLTRGDETDDGPDDIRSTVL